MARVLGTLAMMAWLVGCSAGEPAFVDFANLERPATPNTYLVCPPERTSATVDRAPPVFDVPREGLEQVWLGALAGEPRLVRRAAEPEAHRYVFVQRTPILRFPDVIQLEFLEVLPAQSTVCLFSRSVYGRSDFGKNRERVEDWLARIGP